MLLRITAGLAFFASLTAQAQTIQICGWLIETNKPDNAHDFDVWLESDTEIEFLYKIGGAGVVTDGMKAHSPGSGTYVLHAKKPEKVWGFGSTLYPPERSTSASLCTRNLRAFFSEAPTPVLAKFVFQRDVPESEEKAPATLAKKQCVAVKKEK